MRVLTAVTTQWSVGPGTVEVAAIDGGDDDVCSDDELDGERTGLPGLIHCSRTKETTRRMLLDILARPREAGGRGIDATVVALGVCGREQRRGEWEERG